MICISGQSGQLNQQLSALTPPTDKQPMIQCNIAAHAKYCRDGAIMPMQFIQYLLSYMR
jgi:hypothetical protein